MHVVSGLVLWSPCVVSLSLAACVCHNKLMPAINARRCVDALWMCATIIPRRTGVDAQPGILYIYVLPAQVTHTHVMRGDDHVGHRRINSRSAHNQKWFRPGAREGQNKIALDFVTEKAWCTCSLRLCRVCLRRLIFDLLPRGFSTLRPGLKYDQF